MVQARDFFLRSIWPMTSFTEALFGPVGLLKSSRHDIALLRLVHADPPVGLTVSGATPPTRAAVTQSVKPAATGGIGVRDSHGPLARTRG